ncbi:hypothetical protein MUP29_13965 [bacterium]|nr:hypothetical protein [bacterium]
MQGDEPVETPGEGPAPAVQDSSQVSFAASDTATAGTPTAEVPLAKKGAGDEPLDLSEVIALNETGKNDEAAKALEELLAGKLGDAGFTMKKKTKMSAMEKMQLMMQEKQGQ